MEFPYNLNKSLKVCLMSFSNLLISNSNGIEDIQEKTILNVSF